MNEERRKWPRFGPQRYMGALVQVAQDGRALLLTAEIRDASQTGLGLRLAAPQSADLIRAGQRLSIQIRVGGLPLDIDSEIAWAGTGEVGVDVLFSDARSIQRYRAWVTQIARSAREAARAGV